MSKILWGNECTHEPYMHVYAHRYIAVWPSTDIVQRPAAAIRSLLISPVGVILIFVKPQLWQPEPLVGWVKLNMHLLHHQSNIHTLKVCDFECGKLLRRWPPVFKIELHQIPSRRKTLTTNNIKCFLGHQLKPMWSQTFLSQHADWKVWLEIEYIGTMTGMLIENYDWKLWLEIEYIGTMTGWNWTHLNWENAHWSLCNRKSTASSSHEILPGP